MKLRFRETNLSFKHPFTISKGTKTHQPALVVELEHLGYRGYGEAPSISYYGITVEQMKNDLESKRLLLEKFAFTGPDRFWHFVHHLFPLNPFLVCALDIAGWDLHGNMAQKPLYQIWKLDPSKGPLTDYTIGIDSQEQMVAKMKEKPWPIYKIKLGTDNDLEIMRTLRSHTDARFRVDANAAWSLQEALDKIQVLSGLGVEFIEQPLAKDNWQGMRELFEKSPLPLIADESCVAESDVEKCLHHFHGINIKLTKCSGITPALRMIEKARKLELKVMVGCMNESTIGSAAVANLIPLLDYVDMDGPLLLSTDNATGLSYDFGKVSLSGRPGLGISCDRLFESD